MKKDHETCGRKRRFFTRIDAEIKADRCGRRFKKRYNVYKCPTCDGYHLSSIKTYES